MVLRDAVLTLTGSATQLSTALAASGVVANRPTDRYLWLQFQPGGANANPVFLGSTSALTSSAYGVRLEASSGGVPQAPYFPGDIAHRWSGPQLSDWFLLGTSGEKLHVMWYGD